MKIKIIEEADKEKFESEVAALAKQGWNIRIKTFQVDNQKYYMLATRIEKCKTKKK